MRTTYTGSPYRVNTGEDQKLDWGVPTVFPTVSAVVRDHGVGYVAPWGRWRDHLSCADLRSRLARSYPPHDLAIVSFATLRFGQIVVFSEPSQLFRREKWFPATRSRSTAIGEWKTSSLCSSGSSIEIEERYASISIRDTKYSGDDKQVGIEASLFDWINLVAQARETGKSSSVGDLSVEYLKDLVILRSERSGARLIYDVEEWMEFLDGVDEREIRQASELESDVRSIMKSVLGADAGGERGVIKTLKRRRRRRLLRRVWGLVKGNAGGVVQNVVGTLIALLLLAAAGAAVALIVGMVALLGI